MAFMRKSLICFCSWLRFATNINAGIGNWPTIRVGSKAKSCKGILKLKINAYIIFVPVVNYFVLLIDLWKSSMFWYITPKLSRILPNVLSLSSPFAAPNKYIMHLQSVDWLLRFGFSFWITFYLFNLECTRLDRYFDASLVF